MRECDRERRRKTEQETVIEVDRESECMCWTCAREDESSSELARQRGRKRENTCSSMYANLCKRSCVPLCMHAFVRKHLCVQSCKVYMYVSVWINVYLLACMCAATGCVRTCVCVCIRIFVYACTACIHYAYFITTHAHSSTFGSSDTPPSAVHKECSPPHASHNPCLHHSSTCCAKAGVLGEKYCAPWSH